MHTHIPIYSLRVSDEFQTGNRWKESSEGGGEEAVIDLFIFLSIKVGSGDDFGGFEIGPHSPGEPETLQTA